MKTSVIVFALIFCSSLITTGQRGVVLKTTTPEGEVTFVRFDPDTLPLQLSQSQKVLREFLQLSNNDEMRLVYTNSDDLGFTHQYFQQYFKGIRVEYGVYAVHAKNNLIETIIGNYLRIKEGPKIDIFPQLSENIALTAALKNLNAKTYKWQVPEEEKWIANNFNSTYYPKGDLVLILDKYNTGAYRLAWKFDIYANEPLSRDYVFVDAINGEIIKKSPKIYNTNSNATGDTRYSSLRSFVSDSFENGFRLRETRNGIRIETYNMLNQGTNYGTATDFIDNNNTWSAVEFHNANRDDAALDAHWAGERIYEYFHTVHGRNSWSGTGQPLLNYVHANLLAFGYGNNVNAFWDGQRMTYGDGDGVNYDPLTSLDICAHEVAHGVCGTSARLAYENESGAINEGFSDIWAASIERWAAPEKETWLIGEDYPLPPNGHPARNMSNPNEYNQPDTYLGTYWIQTGCLPFPAPSNDFCGVHTNSGVLNFWYRLLSDGGNGSNDNNNTYSVWPIGINKASQIAYRTETIILPQPTPPAESTITFNQLRMATITAATDLFGANSCEVKSVTNAWYAVGVGSNYSDPVLSLSGDLLVCTNRQFTLLNALKLDNSYSHITWSINPSNLVSPSVGISNVSNFTKIANGNPIITYVHGCNINNYSKQFHTGPYSSSDYPISGPSSAQCNTYVYYSIPQLEGVTTTNWTWPSQFTYVSGQGTRYLALRAGRTGGTIGVGVNNNCGPCGSYATKYTSVYGSCGYSFLIYPNPASDELTVELTENEPVKNFV